MRIALAFMLTSLVAVAQGPPEHIRKARELLQTAAAYDQSGDLDRALETCQQLAQTPQFRPQALFHIATIHARRDDPARALEFLRLVRETGSFDMDQVRSDPRLASLQNHPELARVMPKPADFANPFVDKVLVIHELRGEAKGDQFGWIARRLGDVDGDRVADFVTSAPTHTIDGQPAGRIYVYSGKSGKLLWSASGQGGEQLGIGVELAGDVNRDRAPDVIAGAPGSGYAYVYSGRDGKLLFRIGSGDTAESFGRHTSTAGDVNGDAHDDVIVGAPGAKQSTGAAYVFSGQDGSLLRTFSGEKAGDQFGSTVAGHRDRRHPFVMIGAPGAGPRGTGRVYVYRGLSTERKFIFDSDETGGAFGMMFLSIVGDVNADKVPDLYVSDWANRAKGLGTGRIYVYSGADGSLLHTLTGEAANDGFGIGVADAGDVNRDGSADLVIGAWQHASAAMSAGKVYLYSGKTGERLATYTCRIAGDTFGFDTTNLGDVDGDGSIDLLVTSAWSGVNGFRSGRVFVISSGVTRRGRGEP